MSEPVLRNSPLTTVVCELRFQPLEAEPQIVPLADRLQPLGLTSYTLEEGLQLQMGPGQIQPQSVQRHRFATSDGIASLALDRGTFSYETSAYPGIDDFLVTFSELAGALGEVLGIAARTRIGLRYVNEIELPSAEREAVQASVAEGLLPPWGEPHLEELSVSMHELRFKQDGGEIAVRHGLQRQPSPVYLLDFDHYEQRLLAFDGTAETERLREFNSRIYQIFRWSITEESYQRFDPEEPPHA